MWNLPPMKPDGIILYLRKSRTDDPILSVEEVLAKHEQMLDEWVERNLPGLGRVPEENRYREVVSGETLDSRPKVQEVLRRIESPRIKAVLIVEPQRLSRGDLEDIVRTVFVLNLDSKLLCKEDCKGLCPQCGKNLNDGPCNCRKELDPRFAALKQLLEK